MSSLTHESMINSHSFGLFNRLSQTLHLWRARQRQRRELTQFTDYQLHDVGLSWSDVLLEARKPFWRP
jgi:uncharacterized protein YjiS (DUF1127 family)